MQVHTHRHTPQVILCSVPCNVVHLTDNNSNSTSLILHKASYCFGKFQLPKSKVLQVGIMSPLLFCLRLISGTHVDCRGFYEGGARTNGVYNVYMHWTHKVPVYCDMTTNPGGWTVCILV